MMAYTREDYHRDLVRIYAPDPAFHEAKARIVADLAAGRYRRYDFLSRTYHEGPCRRSWADAMRDLETRWTPPKGRKRG